MSLEDSNKDSSEKQEAACQEDVDLLIKLEPDDAEIQDIGGDDSKLNIIGDITRNEQTTKLNENKVENPEGKSGETDIKKGCTSKSFKSNHIWVSNITRNIKASDLKKLFNQAGRVSSVKILTNGKNLYGYVTMENGEIAAKCVKDFNNTIFNDEKITVSKNRPDIAQKASDSGKKKSDKSKRIKVENSNKNQKYDIVKNKADNNKDNQDNENKNPDSEEQYRNINKLQSKIDTMYSLNCKLQRRFDEMQRLYNNVIVKYNTLKNEMKKIKDENREERRRLNLDKENFERKKKIEESRLDLDRMTLNKELSETRKLKDNLKLKFEEAKYQQKASKRTRSPLRSPRRRSPLGSRNVTDNYKDISRSEKKFKRSNNYNRDRTPSPPNLAPEISKRPGNVNAIPSRPSFYSDGMKSNGAGFAYRQGNVYAQNQWGGPYQKDQRRSSSNVNQGNNFQNARYSGLPATHPPSSVVVPPRIGNSYYQHW